MHAKNYAMKNEKITVFLVDDSEVAAESLAEELKNSLHCTVRKFYTAEDCLMHLGEHPDLVLADYYLDADYSKRMNGDQLLSKIRKEQPHLPVIMYSARNTAEVVRRLMRLGASAFVPKEKNFIRIVRNAVARQVDKIRTEYADTIARREIITVCLLFIAAVFALHWCLPEVLPYFMIALYVVGCIWLFFGERKKERTTGGHSSNGHIIKPQN